MGVLVDKGEGTTTTPEGVLVVALWQATMEAANRKLSSEKMTCLGITPPRALSREPPW